MTYKRDVQADETIPLPIEMVYNLTTDSLTIKVGDIDIYFQNGIQHFNRLYFKYQPKWKTSDVGEKIIDIRKMNMHRKNDLIKFNLYIRKYLRITFYLKTNELFGENVALKNEDDDDKIQQVIQWIKILLMYSKLIVICV